MNEGLKSAVTSADQIYRYYALRAIAAVYGDLKDPKLAHEGLKSAVTSADQIDDPISKSDALSAIAAVYGDLKDPKLAHEVLKSAVTSADQIDDPSSKSDALSAIASAYGDLKDYKGLENTLKAAEEANAEETLEVVSVKYAYLKDWGQSLHALRNCPESQKVSALTKILTLWAELKNPKLIDGAVIVEKPEISKKDNTITVKLYGPIKGCQQYIDWWEILSEDQQLLDRQHFEISHEDQQPFPSRSKPIQVTEDQTLLFRAHLHLEDKNTTGYEARQAWQGTIKDGFKMIRLPENYATHLAKADPQPQACQERSTT